MKRFLLIAFSFITISAFAQPAKHVVLISIDGMRPEFYQDPAWGMNNVRGLMQEGVYARQVRSVFPSYTYPSHTAIVTGALPVHHGIYYNSPFAPLDTPGRWYWEAAAIKTPTLWDAVRKAGLKSAAITWPVTVGAPIDYNIPETWPWPKGSNLDRLPASSALANPPGFFEELQQNATGKLAPDDYNLNYLAMDENIARMGAYILKKYKPALLALHLACVDHFEHEDGRDGESVKTAVQGADRDVKTILEAIEKAGLKESTAVIVLGDHGHFDTHTSLQPNIWLTDAGFTMPSQGTPNNWKAMFHTAAGSAFLQLKDSNDVQTLNKVKTIIANLPASTRKLFTVMDKTQIRQYGGDPNAALALAAMNGVVFSATVKGAAIKGANGGAHGYLPDAPGIQTGFIGCGAGFKKGMVIPVMGLEDVAPIVAQLLGLDFKAPDGVLFPGILK